MRSINRLDRITKSCLARNSLTSIAAAGSLLLFGALSSQAANVLKSATGTDLNAPASWGGATPTSADVATWDGTSLGAGLTLGANTNWQGVSVSGALTDISVTGSGVLTVGSGGFDLSASANNMTLANSTALSADQSWNINSGKKLTVRNITSSAASLTMTGNGTLKVGNGANTTINGALNMQAGTLQYGGNDMTVNGALTGTGTIENGSSSTTWFNANVAANTTFGGILRDGSGGGRMGFVKQGAGTLTLTNGANAIGDNLSINAGGGKVIVTNGGTYTAGFTWGAAWIDGVLEIDGANVNYPRGNNVWDASVNIGDGSGTAGAIYLNSGTLNSFRQIAPASANGSYGAFVQTGGAATNGGFIAIGLGSGHGIFDQRGGVFTMTNAPVTCGAGSGSLGLMNFSGNAVYNQSVSGDNGIWVGENGTSAFNVFGNAVVNFATDNYGLRLGVQTSGAGTVNLLGGTVVTKAIYKSSGSGTLNFNGGTVKANQANTAFLTGLNAAYVYSGGATIDDGAYAITVGQQLQAPSGDGVASIPVTAGGSNYIAALFVQISGDGSGATAIAQIDYAAGTVTNILITCPGNNYSTVSTVTLSGGGGSGATLGTATLGANTSGGLTKTGSGTLTLSGGTTYTGPTIVNAGTLSLSPISVSYSSTPLTVSNATLALDVSGGATSLAATSATLKNNATLSVAYGNLPSGNPSAAALNVSGGLSAPGTGITIKVAGAGFAKGAFPVIAYTGTTLPNLANFSLVLPTGAVGVLSNDTANSSVDIVITSVGQLLTWYGADSLGNPLTTWNINTSSNWNTGMAKYLEYGSYGDAVIFDDTALNTSVNLGVSVKPSVVTVNNSSASYTISGGGSIGGSTAITKNGTGSLGLYTANSYTGGTVLNAGTLAITNNNALGAVSGGVTLAGGVLQLNGPVANSRSLAMSVDSEIGVGAGVTASLNGVISGSSSGLTKTDGGTLTLGGNNTYSGPTLVNAGTLSIAGSVAGGDKTIAPQAGNAAAAVSGSFTSGTLVVGAVSGANGAVRQTAGTISVGTAFFDHLPGGYGYGRIDGGTFSMTELQLGNWGSSGGNGGDALFEINGGTVVDSGWLVAARGGAAQTAVLNIFSGSLSYAGGGFVNNWGSGQTTIINVMGGSLATTANNEIGFLNGTGIVNLNGGVATVSVINGGWGPARGQVNFNGGTLRAAAATGNLLSVTEADVFSGGAIIDDNGAAVTVSQPLLAPAGYGVSSVSLSDGGSGYIAPPIVTISGGVGSNATAVATVAGGVVTGITVTSPGSGYDASDVLYVSFTGGGASAVAPTVSGVSLAANVSGGLTKIGAGTLTLSGANTYTGNTVVSTGTLLITPTVQSSSSITVADNANFGVTTSSTTTGAAIGGLTLGVSGASSLSFAYGVSGIPTVPTLTAGAVTINGSAKIKVSGSLSVGAYPVLKYSSVSGSFAGVVSPRGATATISNDAVNKVYYVVVSSLGGGIVWDGTTGLIPNLWDINVTTNWLTGAQPTTYQETVPPGDAVTFTDSGSGQVVLSNTVSPLSVTISNTAKAYSIDGPGQINSLSGLKKVGGGTMSVNVPAKYTGSSVISNGTYNIGANHSFVNLSGDGTLGTMAGSPALTLSNSVATTFSGPIGGALSLTKNGNGTLRLAGNNTYSGATTVSQGALSVSGTVDSTAGVSTVANGTNQAILDVTGSFGADYNSGAIWSSSINVGNDAGSVGIVRLSTPASTFTSAKQLALGLNGYAAFSQSAGSTTIGGFMALGGNATGAVFNQSGGTVTMTGAPVTIGYASTASEAVMILSGSALFNVTGSGNGVWPGEVGTGTLNLLGNASLNITNSGVELGLNNAAGVGTFNLDGGTASVNSVSQGKGSGYLNFNGGTLKANTNNASFMTGLTAATIYGGGTKIDDGGFAITIGQILASPSGDGVASISVDTAGAGYLDAPVVIITGGSGTGATAIAQINPAAGTVTNILITCPGTGYVNGDSLTVTLSGGGASAPVTVGATVTFAANTAGNLVKLGAGTLTLDGVNTYTGATVVNAGTLAGTGTIAGALTNNATLSPGDSGIGSLTVNGNIVLKAGSTNVFDVNGTTPANNSVVVGANVTYGGVLKIVPAGTFTAGQEFQLFSGTGATNASNFASIAGSPGSGLAFSFTNGTLSVVTGIASYPTNISYSVSGSTMDISWPATHLGWILQAQTNSLSTGLGTNWVDVAGSDSVTNENITVSPNAPAVFYRLRKP
jgi:fibronectin-binding autotransporter adhesin